MRRLLCFVCVLALLPGCAITPAPKVKTFDVKVRAAKLSDAAVFDAAAALTEADTAYAHGRFAEGLTAYQTIIMRAPDDFEGRGDALLGAADCAIALAAVSPEYLASAGAALMAAEKSGASNARLYASKTLLAIALGVSDDAEVQLNAALEANLDDPRLWNALGRFHDGREEWMAALETYVKAAYIANQNDKPLSPIINNMGMSLLMQGRSEEALDKFTQAVDLNPDTQIYDNNRRLALLLIGDPKTATQGIEDKALARIYNDAGYISARRGQTGTARSFYQSAINLSPVYFAKAEENLKALP